MVVKDIKEIVKGKATLAYIKADGTLLKISE